MGSQAGATTKVDVTITASTDESKPQGIAWSADYRPIPPGNGQQNGNKFQILAAGGVDFRFTLDDQTGLDLAFAPSGRDAIFVAQGEGCPQSPGDGNGEFEIDEKTQPHKAGMFDRNSIEGPFSYTLNFSSSQGAKEYDPIIINRTR